MAMELEVEELASLMCSRDRGTRNGLVVPKTDLCTAWLLCLDYVDRTEYSSRLKIVAVLSLKVKPALTVLFLGYKYTE